MCVFMQKAVKELLAVPSSVSICIRFSDPPHSSISSLHTVLQIPTHTVNLTVSPLSSMSAPCSIARSSTNSDVTTFLQTKDCRDPYCQYRDMYRNPQKTAAGRRSSASRDSDGFVRQKYDFAEMNRLLSQLTEVSLSLERTREECDMIARKCSFKTKRRWRGKECSYAKDKNEVDHGAMVDLYPTGETVALEKEVSDRKVEELIHLAESVTLGQQGETASMLVCSVREQVWKEHAVVLYLLSPDFAVWLCMLKWRI